MTVDKKSYPNGVKILVHSGSGQDGEGAFGGHGGYGESKTITIKEFETIDIQVFLEKKASNGNDSAEKYLHGIPLTMNRGGIAGDDIHVKISCDKKDMTVTCHGGGGGGGGGDLYEIPYKDGVLNFYIEAGDGGSNFEKCCYGRANGLKGGNGVDGSETNTPYIGMAGVSIEEL